MNNIVNLRLISVALSIASFTVPCAYSQTATKPDTSPHQVQFVSVDKDITLEVLDWGGNGPPLIFLAGLGDTAHVFDTFAPKFTTNHHVYGITRRGFGKSSAPPSTEEDYAADRLGDDVLAVIDVLKLDRPVLVGHSIAGEELSSVGSRHPEKIAGLVYLDAGLAYAYYDPARWEGGLIVDANELRRKLDLLMLNQTMVGAVRDLAQGNLLSQFERDLQVMQKQFQGIPATGSGMPVRPLSAAMQIEVAISKGERKYTSLKCPMLSLIAWPSDAGPPLIAQASAFERIPSAHVVRLQNANHYIFRSNEADVEREMKTFMDALKPPN
jgi:non-heme chloroperoxidase